MLPNPFERKYMHLGHGQWTKEVSLQAKDITQCRVRELYLNNNYRPTVVQDIAHIHFTALTRLDLISNSIESIEGLARVQMPHIQILTLGRNNITSAGAMRKAAWPKLRRLSIQNNYFGDAKGLVLGCFPQMQTLLLYRGEGESKDKNRLPEQCFLAKLQAASLEYLYIHQSKSSCFDRSISRVLKQKWLKFQIH